MQKHKILLVEDSIAIQEAIQSAIQNELNIEVEAVRTKNATRQILQSSRQDFFLAILDLNLPDSPQGGVVDMVLNAGIPPIILTSITDGILRNYMMKKPVIDYIIKKRQHEIHYLIDTIRRILENKSRKVLVVDDSSTTRLLVRELLERQFLTVLEAADGTEGLKILEECRNEICLVITDYNMPNMDGEEFILKAREKFSRHDLAIISISASDESDISVKLLKAGANDFITKPFSFEEFFCRINQNIDSVAGYRCLKNTAES
ncbi:MAG: response regulator [Spirochaetia bacterium]|nr:response regulator [Spirochaetia bacterium]